ncbi:MAG: NADH-quinone oxidoreductase subunit NuoE [Planctomycetes bacterium]|nr:NADH-quinone oxidoreductase subunit NuoE [Planctomycetota bacterium]
MQERIETVLSQFEGHRSEMIPLLQDVQEEFGYIPAPAMERIADFINIPSSRVYGVATFYAQFYLTRQGEHRIKLCQGTACHVRGAKKILDTLEETLGIGAGETTEDYRFSLETVACFGSCALAPVMVVDGEVHGRMTPQKAEEIVEDLA